MEENIKRKDCDEIHPKNNLQWKWQWFKEFYFLKYTRTKECPHSVCKTRLCGGTGAEFQTKIGPHLRINMPPLEKVVHSLVPP